MSIDLKALAAEFPKPAVHWRVQGKPYERNGTHSAMALAYIDARDVMDRLDEVCGPENWQTQYSETAAGRVLCSIGIRFGDEWIWKTDGAGNTAVEGEKGGISDALKRAAVSWGIGRYLYRLSSPWVECTVNPKNGAWKAWVGDPWAKVKVVGYQQPEAPKAAEKDPEDMTQRIVKALEAAEALPKVNSIRYSGHFKDHVEWVAKDHPDHAKRIKDAEDKALRRIDPAMQRPADEAA